MNLSHYSQNMLFVSFSTPLKPVSCPTFLSMYCEASFKSVKKSFNNQSFIIYRNGLKNREFDKEALQNFDLERVTIVQGQGASEDRNFEGQPTRSKTDSSVFFGIMG